MTFPDGDYIPEEHLDDVPEEHLDDVPCRIQLFVLRNNGRTNNLSRLSYSLRELLHCKVHLWT